MIFIRDVWLKIRNSLGIRKGLVIIIGWIEGWRYEQILQYTHTYHSYSDSSADFYSFSSFFYYFFYFFGFGIAITLKYSSLIFYTNFYMSFIWNTQLSFCGVSSIFSYISSNSYLNESIFYNKSFTSYSVIHSFFFVIFWLSSRYYLIECSAFL